MSERSHIDFAQYQEDLAQLLYITQVFGQAIIGFDDHQREATLFGEWSLKDVVAHFSAWAQLTVASIERARTDEPIPMLLSDEECDQFNADEVAVRKSSTWQEVMEEFASSEKLLLNCYRALLENETNETLLEFVTYCIGWDVGHYQEHMVAL